MQIIQTALKLRTTVYVIVAFIVIIGSISYSAMPLENIPNIEIPVMLVSTVYPGVSPEDMERLVTNVLEKELKDLKDIKTLTSSSAESASTVVLEFETGTNLDVAYQKTRDKVEKAKPDLPPDAEAPTIIEIEFSEFPMMLINLTGDYEGNKLKSIAETVQDRIEKIPGVLGVDLTGGKDREIQIYLNPSKMEHYKLGIDKVINRIRQEHRTTPAGSLDLGQSKYSVRIPGEYKDVKKMEDIIVKTPAGHPVRLKDVGMVNDGFKELSTISRINQKECITLKIKRRSGENIVHIADAIRTVFKNEKDLLPDDVEYTIRQDESIAIRDSVSDLENGIITGFIFVMGVLLFSMGVRNASFVAVAIPMSMLMSFIILDAMGITLNIVVLFGLILSLGMLVDNSIVVVENIYRHVSEGKSRMVAAYEATKEVAWPIIASTATTICVFLPLLFWPGVMGDFMKELPITVISVLASSLFVALVINPVVASTFLTYKGKILKEGSHTSQGWLLQRYAKVLDWSLDNPWKVLLSSGGLFLATVILFGMFGAGVELFPTVTPKRAQVIVKTPQGTRLQQTDTIVKQVETLVQDEKNIKDVVSNVGVGGTMFAGGSPTNQAILNVEFQAREDRTENTWDTVESVRKKISDIPGAEIQVETESMGPPRGAPVSIEIFGPDFETIADYADKVKALIATVPGVVDIRDDYESGKPEIRIDVDREKAMLRKVNTASISNAVRAAINGIEASVLREGDEEYDIIVRYDKRFRTSIEDILDIRVTGKDDVQIPVRDVATVRTVGGLGSINHIEQKRAIAVTSWLTEERSSPEVMADVKKLLAKELKLPKGYSIKYTGENQDQEETTAFLLKAFTIGIMLMLIILITQFNSVTRPGIILGSVVMSTIGVLIGLVLTQAKFGIMMSGVGVISLAGVVVNNAIVLIDYTDKLKRRPGMTLKKALARAGVVRFRPVLLTAITTVLGLLPMAFEFGIDFRTMSLVYGTDPMEYWGPMARAICYGLIFATVLTLVVVPAMYLVQDNTQKRLGKLLRFKKDPAQEKPTPSDA